MADTSGSGGTLRCLLRARARVAANSVLRIPSRVVRPSKPRLLRRFGPGLIAGAADNDPSSIAMYAQAGAQQGFAIGWTMLASFPLLAAIQEVSARIGCATGKGIAGNLRQYYPAALLTALVILVFVANTLTIAADHGVMGQTLATLARGAPALYAAGLGILSVSLQQRLQYTRYVSFLKWLTLSLLSYVAVLAAIHPSWSAVAQGVIVPTLHSDFGFWSTMVTVMGSTISPALLLWQSSQEAEDARARRNRRLTRRAVRRAEERIRLDTWIGAGYSNSVGLAIIISTAATLRTAGITHINTAIDVARALEPLAGRFAAALFALGIVGTGLLAVPVLAGSAAYALGESFTWRTGLKYRPGEAKAFYGTVTAATVLGALINLSPIDPMSALYWSAILNDIVSVPLMVMIMSMCASRPIMGDLAATRALKVAGWTAAAVMTAGPIAMVLSSVGLL